jgi:hypothetical protein
MGLRFFSFLERCTYELLPNVYIADKRMERTGVLLPMLRRQGPEVFAAIGTRRRLFQIENQQ